MIQLIVRRRTKPYIDLLGTTLGACLLFLVPLASATASDPPRPAFVGSQVCKSCHPDVWSKFFKNPHFKSVASGQESAENTGCEGCHGAGSAHVKAPSKASIAAFSVLTAKQTLDRCLRCHSQALSRANIRRSVHSLSDVTCTGCHSIHKAATPKFLLAKSQTDLCYGCHTSVRSQFSMPSKHRVNEGFMNCTDCHNPHGSSAPTWRMSSRPRMVDQSLANEEPCLKCHSEKRGPFVFEHASVRVEGCESCHSPHGSPNARLLRRPVVFTLCLECHNGAGSLGRQGNGVPRQSGSHNMSDPRYQNCTTCHVRIHGSNADPLFLR